MKDMAAAFTEDDTLKGNEIGMRQFHALKQHQEAREKSPMLLEGRSVMG